MLRRALPLVIALALAGCGRHASSPDGTPAGSADGAKPASTAPAPSAPAAPPANTMSIDVPGLKGSISLPNINLPSKNTDIDGMKLFPGTQLTGMAVAGDETAHGGEGGVTMRYTAPASPGDVLAYYRKAAPSAGFALGAGTANALHASKGTKTAVTIVADAADGGSAGTISVSGD